MQKFDLARRVIWRDCGCNCHADVSQQENQHEPMHLCGEPNEKEGVASQVIDVRLAHLLREFDDDMRAMGEECQGCKARSDTSINHCIVVASLPAYYRVEALNCAFTLGG